MSTHNTKIVLAVVVLILLVATAVWGLSTYGFEYQRVLPSEGKPPRAAGTWSTPVVLAIGLLAGYLSGRYLIRKREPPGGIWTVLAAGVGGAWLGGVLPCPICWHWQDVNVTGSIVFAFALAVGVGRAGAHWYGKRR